jgi:hypothetical protein
LKFSYLAAAAASLVVSAGPALARHDPVPPPSGIVVHLFGPDSITSRVLPNDLGFASAPPAPAASNGTGTPVQGAAVAGGPGAPANSYPEPTMHQILHEMFVTGDPNMAPGSNLATGRKNDHP